MLGTIVNCITVILGSVIGLLVKKGIPDKMNTAIMQGMALCVLYIGISGSLECQNILVVIVSMAIGTVIGEGIDLDKRLNRLGKKLEEKVGKGDGGIARGFVSASLLFCVGSMAIVGSLNSGLMGDHTMLYAKSLLDAISAAIFASTMGWGVVFSAVLVFIYQGVITLAASLLAPVLSTVAINEMTAVGSLIIIALSLNLLGLTKFKVMNFVPAIFIPILLVLFM